MEKSFSLIDYTRIKPTKLKTVLAALIIVLSSCKNDGSKEGKSNNDYKYIGEVKVINSGFPADSIRPIQNNYGDKDLNGPKKNLYNLNDTLTMVCSPYNDNGQYEAISLEERQQYLKEKEMKKETFINNEYDQIIQGVLISKHK